MTEHVVTRVNDGWYVCDECGDTGSERWAITHQFGTEPLIEATRRALGLGQP